VEADDTHFDRDLALPLRARTLILQPRKIFALASPSACRCDFRRAAGSGDMGPARTCRPLAGVGAVGSAFDSEELRSFVRGACLRSSTTTNAALAARNGLDHTLHRSPLARARGPVIRCGAGAPGAPSSIACLTVLTTRRCADQLGPVRRRAAWSSSFFLAPQAARLAGGARPPTEKVGLEKRLFDKSYVAPLDRRNRGRDVAVAADDDDVRSG